MRRVRRAGWLAGLILAAGAGLSAARALPAPVCTHIPREGWISAGEIEAQLQRRGFRLVNLRVSSESCLIAGVLDRRGQSLELRLHPAHGGWLGQPEQPMPSGNLPAQSLP